MNNSLLSKISRSIVAVINKVVDRYEEALLLTSFLFLYTLIMSACFMVVFGVWSIVT